jgi:triosephosphate isomerase
MNGRSHMHIAIDAHSVGTGLAGNETYAANLVEALAEVDRENSYTVYVTRPTAGSSIKHGEAARLCACQNMTRGLTRPDCEAGARWHTLLQ